MTGALIYGISAAVPPVGAVAIPAYTAYGYARLGYALNMAYYEVRLRGGVSPSTTGEVAGRMGEVVAQHSADAIAGQVVAKAQQDGLFKDMTAVTGVETAVIAEMMKGSTSSALSSGTGELAKFLVTRAVGG